jgi:hypothetical protein
MIGSWLTRKRLVLLAIAALLLVGTVLLSIPAVYSQLVSNEILGDEWQCRKIAFLLTCTRLEGVAPAAHGLSRRLLVGRRV